MYQERYDITMMGPNEEDSEAKPTEQGVFAINGPVHLTSLDWGIPEHRRSVAASLVQGVYTLERDRQHNRTGHKALAPIWWEFFHFRCIQILEDQYDSSIFGAMFEYKPYTLNHYYPTPIHNNVPPRYVIAIRGTLIERHTRRQDLYLNMHVALNGLARRSRYQTTFQLVQAITARAGLASLWLAGHSLGAAIALQAGKDMAKMGCYIETYLFNPPFPSAPIEKLKDPDTKRRIRFAGSVVTAGLSVAIHGRNHSKQEYGPFTLLCSWIPNLFVNPMDPICCEYIGYFEHRERMEEMGRPEIERIATKSSIVSLLSGAFGRDGEALHLIPSALLTKNMIPIAQDHKQAHGILQWWTPHPYWHSKHYQLR